MVKIDLTAFGQLSSLIVIDINYDRHTQQKYFFISNLFRLRNFRQKSKCKWKIEILVKNRNLSEKSKF